MGQLEQLGVVSYEMQSITPLLHHAYNQTLSGLINIYLFSQEITILSVQETQLLDFRIMSPKQLQTSY